MATWGARVLMGHSYCFPSRSRPRGLRAEWIGNNTPYRVALIISSGMDAVPVGLHHQIVSSSNRTIQSPASVGT